MQVQVKVFSGVNALDNNNRLFERVIDVHDDIFVPYQSLVDNLKFLFGSSCIVTFNIQ